MLSVKSLTWNIFNRKHVKIDSITDLHGKLYSLKTKPFYDDFSQIHPFFSRRVIKGLALVKPTQKLPKTENISADQELIVKNILCQRALIGEQI